MANLTPAEQLLHNTIRIECITPNGTSTGSGFFFSYLLDGGVSVPVIVTNKHVVRNSLTGKLRFTLADANNTPLYGQHKVCDVNNFQQCWIPHPDSNIDLCILPINPILHVENTAGNRLFHVSITKNEILSLKEEVDLNAIENIIMVGCPNGIWDQANNLPLIRQGITATHPSFNFNNEEEFMIDAACFNGSSGSPVFLYNENGYHDKQGNYFVGANRVKLLGILHAGPQHIASGEIRMVDIPVVQHPLVLSGIPNNLGKVIKARKLLDFEPILNNLLAAQQP